VPELKHSVLKTSPTELQLGTGISLSEAIVIFKRYSNSNGLGYLNQISEHVARVANHQVRNVKVHLISKFTDHIGGTNSSIVLSNAYV
jgi:hypothetical protein